MAETVFACPECAARISTDGSMQAVCANGHAWRARTVGRGHRGPTDWVRDEAGDKDIGAGHPGTTTQQQEPLLGLATTEQLLNELVARAEIQDREPGKVAHLRNLIETGYSPDQLAYRTGGAVQSSEGPPNVHPLEDAP